METPTLHTPRLTLRPLERSDAGAMQEALSDSEVMRYWDWPGTQSMDEAQSFIDNLLGEVSHGSTFFWTICVNKHVAGVCDLTDVDTYHRRAEVGFMMIKRFWGQGYAFEAMGAVIEFGVQKLHLERLSARTHKANLASIALLSKLGFEPEGTLKGFTLRDGTRHDCELYGRVYP